MSAAKLHTLLGGVILLSLCQLTSSCRSIAKAHSEKEYGGKEPISNPSKPSRNYSSRKSSSSNKSSTKKSSAPSRKLTPKVNKTDDVVVAAEKEKPDAIKPEPEEQRLVESKFEIDDESIAMEDIPEKPQAPKNEKVPGIEALINQDGPILVKEDNANRIIEANGKDVVLSGNNGVIVISGGCDTLTIKGTDNQVQCDSVKLINVPGNDNVLILGSMGGGTMKGSGNDLSWGSGMDGLSPIVESFGSNNSMKRIE